MIQTNSLVESTEKMIDALKTVCADYGLANDSSEYKIITETFLYKFLNDKFLHELRTSSQLADAQNIEQGYTALTQEQRDLLQFDFVDTAFIQPEYLLSFLFNKQNESDFDKIFDEALHGISDDNIDIFSIRTGGKEKIRLFNGVSEHVAEPEKRADFCRALINKLCDFSFEEAFGQKYDFFSTVFEYLIRDYNKDSGKYGEYFTPHAIANIIARILTPKGDKNVTIYDPAAGSGTLVLALAHEIGENNCTIYTQDRSQKANEFMRLNLILNNLVHSLPNVVHDDTLISPRHLSKDGKSIRQFDYIVSNPPFNCDFSSTRNTLAGENYAKRFWAGVPNVPGKKLDGMKIYLMFLQHIIVSLKPGGKAAVVVPTGFLTAKAKIESTIRKYLIDNHMLRGVISMPSNIFANTGTNVSVLFIDSSKQYDHALLVDASKLGEKVKLDGKNQRTVLSTEEIEKIVNVFNDTEEVDDFSVLASYEDIEAKNYSFSAGQYFEIKIEYVDLTPEEFKAEIDTRLTNLQKLWSKGAKLQSEIEIQMKQVYFE